MFRNPIVFKGKVLKMLIGFALCSMTFANLGNGPNDMQDHYGAIFMLVSNAIMEALTSAVATFQTQKPVFLREYCGRKYGVAAFYMSYSAAMVPIELMYAMGIYALTYYVMGLNPAFDRFVTMVALGGMGSLCGSGFALAISSIAPTIEVASAMAPLFFLPMMLSGGFLVSYKDVPNWLFFQYISPFRFLFEAAVRTDIEHNENIKHAVSKAAIDTLDLPESYVESIMLIFTLAVSLRLLGMALLKLVSRNY
jgi:ABC-type multidrug transport system permease subunit